MELKDYGEPIAIISSSYIFLTYISFTPRLGLCTVVQFVHFLKQAVLAPLPLIPLFSF